MQFYDSHYIDLKVILSEPKKKTKEQMIKNNKNVGGREGKVFLQH